MMFTDFKETISYLNSAETIGFDESFSLSGYCSKLLRKNESENKGREILIRALDAWNKIDSSTYPIWYDLIDSAGLYPYLKFYLNGFELSGSSLIRLEYHKSPHLRDIYLHEEQQKVSFELLSKRSVVLSAPTSFGKSLLIEEIVASKIYKNIVVIQPTLALLDETRKKLKKYRSLYKLIVSTNQVPSESMGNIFLFTGERVVEYDKFQSIDFFVIDEFYKLSLKREDDRAIILNQAFYKLLKLTTKFYLLGPIVKSVPKDFKKTFQFQWYHTSFATVAVDEFNLYLKGKKLKKEAKSELLFELLDHLEDPTLIYCSSPSKASNLTLDYIRYLKKKKDDDNSKSRSNNHDIIEWIDENIHINWILKSALKRNIAFHHGAIPRHLGSSIVDEFNSGNIKFLFCTSTLIEGVNTTAKNVVLYDKTKGRKSIDYFDYRNISGRSGRMYKHFVGKVFRIEPEPVQLELDIDIPIVTQADAPPELLIQLDDEDLLESSKSTIKIYRDIDAAMEGVLRKNAGVPLGGQIQIVKEILDDVDNFHSLLSWTGVPTYEQLKTVLSLAWNNLLRKNENKGSVTSPEQLAYFASRYYQIKSLKRLIQEQSNSDWALNKFPNDEERINIAVYMILNISRHWFNYKLPKWLNVMSNLQEFVFGKINRKKGNYAFFASQIEKGFLPPNLYTLFEHEIPISALRKLESAIKIEDQVDEIFKKISTISLEKYGLNNYEIKKIKSIL